jgi:hypothetical protein
VYEARPATFFLLFFFATTLSFSPFYLFAILSFSLFYPTSIPVLVNLPTHIFIPS